MYGEEGFGYWPPFADESPPNGIDRPAAVVRPVTTILPDGNIGTVDMEIPCYYL